MRIIILVWSVFFKYSAWNVFSQQMLSPLHPQKLYFDSFQNWQAGFLFKTIKFLKVEIAHHPANLCHSQFTGGILRGVLFQLDEPVSTGAAPVGKWNPGCNLAWQGCVPSSLHHHFSLGNELPIDPVENVQLVARRGENGDRGGD